MAKITRLSQICEINSDISLRCSGTGHEGATTAIEHCRGNFNLERWLAGRDAAAQEHHAKQGPEDHHRNPAHS